MCSPRLQGMLESEWEEKISLLGAQDWSREWKCLVDNFSVAERLPTQLQPDEWDSEGRLSFLAKETSIKFTSTPESTQASKVFLCLLQRVKECECDLKKQNSVS